MNLLDKSRIVTAALVIFVLGLAAATLYALDSSHQGRNQNFLMNSSGIFEKLPENVPASRSTQNTQRTDQMGNSISDGQSVLQL